MPDRKLSHRSLAIQIETLRRTYRDLDNRISSMQARNSENRALIKHLNQERLRLRYAIQGAQALMSQRHTHRSQFAI